MKRRLRHSVRRGKLGAYQKAGVDPELAARLVRGIVDRFPGGGPLPKNYFCKLMPMPAGISRKGTYLALSADGVGTKLLLGLQTGLLDGIGQDLAAMIYNDLITSGAEPFAFLDYYATGQIRPGQYRSVLASIEKACRACRMPLVGGETAEMPGLYRGSHFDLAGFGVGWLREQDALSPAGVRPGHILIGFPSTGFHSNGFSLIRDRISRHSLNLNRPLTLNGRTLPLKRLLMEPTRLYTSLIDAIRKKKFRPATLSHITGGGLDENLPRSIPRDCRAVIREKGFDAPSAELFRWFSRQTRIPWREMMRTFNCGFGMIAVCNAAQVRSAERLFPDCVEIGWIDRNRKRDAAITVIP